MRFTFLFGVVFLLLAVLGGWLDRLDALEQTPLFISFHVASLAGVALAVIYMWPRLPGMLRKTVLIIAALVIWRVSYFPIMVIAGWFATLGDWLIIQTQWMPTIIYPTFLVMIAVMNMLAIILGGWAVHYRRYLVLPVLSGALAIAVTVSFSNQSDLRLLPDRSVTLAEAPPAFKAPVGNPYYPVLFQSGYNHVLIFASAAMYSAIPATPWATTVKTILEHEFRETPRASSERRVIDHYLAFRGAHQWIACHGVCRENWRKLLLADEMTLSATTH